MDFGCLSNSLMMMMMMMMMSIGDDYDEKEYTKNNKTLPKIYGLCSRVQKATNLSYTLENICVHILVD